MYRPEVGQQIRRGLVVDVAPDRGVEPSRQHRRQLRRRQACAAVTRRLAGGLGIPVAVDDRSFIIAHQPAYVGAGENHAASGIAVTDRSLVESHQSADIVQAGNTSHAAGRVAVANSRADIILAYQSADTVIAIAAYIAGGIAVSDDSNIIGAAEIIIKPNQAANLATASAGAACGVAVADRPIVIPCQPADIGIACYAACGVAIAKCSEVVSHQTTDVIIITADAACGVAVADGGIEVVPSCQSADIAVTAYIACGITIADSPAIISTNQPTYFAGSKAATSYIAGGVTATYGSIIFACQSADSIAAVYIAGRIACADRASVIPNQSAGRYISAHAAADQPDIADGAGGIAEQTYIVD